MPRTLGAYAEFTAMKGYEDDLWIHMKVWAAEGYKIWPNSPCQEPVTEEEKEIIKKHSERLKPDRIMKGEKLVRKFFYSSYGSSVWMGNWNLYQIAIKYAVVPPDNWDFSTNTNSAVHVYNQKP